MSLIPVAYKHGDPGGLVGWGTMLQARRLRFESRRGHWIFFNLPNPSSPWGLLSLQHKWVPKCFWGVDRGRSVRLITSSPSVSRLSGQCGILNTSRPVTGIALLSLSCPQARRWPHVWWCLAIACRNVTYVDLQTTEGSRNLQDISVKFLRKCQSKRFIH
jgi:hypothetical protein